MHVQSDQISLDFHEWISGFYAKRMRLHHRSYVNVAESHMKTVAEETNPVSLRILGRAYPEWKSAQAKSPENISNDAIFRKQLNRSIAFEFQNEVIVQLVSVMSGVRCTMETSRRSFH